MLSQNITETVEFLQNLPQVLKATTRFNSFKWVMVSEKLEIGAAYTLSSQIPPTPVRQASMCKDYEFVISGLKILVEPLNVERKQRNQSVSW